jgi:carbonic anhydrase/acetyltransferase-like protein (isoleucine patch superfamily)
MTPHSVTGIPPFELFYGRPVQVVNKIRSPDEVAFVEFTPEQYNEIARSKQQRVKTYLKMAWAHILVV